MRRLTPPRIAAALLAALLLANRRSLAEGLRYLAHLLAWDPAAATPVSPAGPFGICHELAAADNAGRCAAVERELRRAGLDVERIPVPGEALPSLLVRLGGAGPTTVFAAHYDKSRETPAYQGACDNTAAVAALLSAAGDLAAAPPAIPVALLFTAAEERGMLGAQAFVAWAGRAGLAVERIVNFDMVGRGRLATRPSALPGIYLWLPGLGELAYDGRALRRGRPYPQPDPALLADIRAALGPALVEYRRFTARSDSNVYQAAGIPTVSVSSDDMAYLDRVWERDEDRVELLDEANLELARRLVLALSRPARAPARPGSPA